MSLFILIFSGGLLNVSVFFEYPLRKLSFKYKEKDSLLHPKQSILESE